ncbi:protein translocase subunit SecF [Halothermothrix orenii]|uniref:Protein-export membrane protein SecF n=1 Tax=Halothermothrix orenii (strain H 168 / OCM 544 / DSM 9562) TaxID=373903 RepID=B8CXF6_HALOH|nr:protein translocase subunit SecF [Halothermothrix orenii]ACL69975.1 protein-export membrane protein SecF [Halothermothrix orenii H 168]
MDLMGKRKIWYTISLTIIVLGLIFLMVKGLNFGIDFQGGTLMELKFDKYVSKEDAREVLATLNLAKSSKIQQTEEVNGVIIRTHNLSSEQISEIKQAFKEKYPSTEVLRTDMVGPLIGKELRIKAFWALLIASIAIVLYISLRFEFRFAIVAIIALLHDVIITIGLFAIIGREINTPFVAALLTIVGYSINDTIVIFDRIRENMKLMRGKPFIEQANQAVIDTLPRSINTSLTTLVAVLAIYLFGGASIKTFMLALFIGILAGTYSSIFVASPLLVSWDKKLISKK